MIRWITVIAALGVATPSSAKTNADASDALAREGVASNPSLAAIKARVAGLDALRHSASAWNDPMLAVEYSNVPIDSWTLGDHAMSGVQLKLQQTFFFPGKTRLREAVVAGQAREERQLLAERKVQLAAAVKRAYYRLALTRQLRSVTREHVKLVEQFTDVVRVKYEVGKVGQHDLLRLDVLVGQLRDDLKRFDRDERALVAAINATRHRPPTTPIQTPDRVHAAAPAIGTKELKAIAAAKRPLLRRLVERSRTQRAAAERSAKEGYPDVTAWIGYRFRAAAGADPGTDFFSVGVSLPLPIFNDSRWGSKKRRHEALSDAAREQRAAEVDRIEGAIEGQLARWQRAAQEAATYRKDLMPRAHRVLDATFAAYQVDRADFASLYQAELQLLSYERVIRRAEARAELARVEIEALTGSPQREWSRK